ncbi:undecaprenyl-diphosphate phosphatase [bacterium]|nr:undecaprenyl-diphosphate phosphatase [bacterium]
MTIFEAVLLGIIQGLTEFLPISSSGHLVVGQKVLGIAIAGNAFEVVVHLGTLISVLIVFWSDIWQLIKSLKSAPTQKYILALAIGTVPAVIIGLLFKDVILEAFENIRVVASTLIITGIILLTTKFIKTRLMDISIGHGLLIGIAQAMAIVPGISRSGMTISLGMHLGITPEKAAKFSFLLAIPAIAGAGLLTGLDIIKSSEPILPGSVLIVGFLSSFLVGWISLKWLLQLIKSGKFHWFGVYCIFVGLLSWIL